jgi:2-octaprenyl-6-methoxyphenol hydroxylase
MSSNLHFYCPANVINLSTNTQPKVEIEQNGEKCLLTAKLIISADGTMSHSRKLLGIKTKERDYKKTAFVSSIQLQHPHNNIAYQRFSELGTLAFLPMQNNKMGFVCTGSHAQIQDLQNQNEQELLKTIEQAVGHRLGRLQALGPRYTYPLKEIIAEQQTLPGLILLGNAAHNISPVAAQGFNLALQEVYSLVQLIQKYDDLNQVVIEYEKTVSPLQKKTITFTDNLMRWFEDDKIASHFMGLGLGLLDALPQLKKRFSQKPAGLNANMKRLLRDEYEHTL